MGKKFVVLAGHPAQVNLTHRALALILGLEDVDTNTIDAYKVRHKHETKNPEST